MEEPQLDPLRNPAGLGRTLVAASVGLVYFFPVIWMILAAFKTRADALATPPGATWSSRARRTTGAPAPSTSARSSAST